MRRDGEKGTGRERKAYACDLRCLLAFSRHECPWTPKRWDRQGLWPVWLQRKQKLYREHDRRLLRNEISEQRTPSRPCATPRPHRYHGTGGIINSCDYGINSSLLSLRQSLNENKPIKKADITFKSAVDAGKTWMFVFSKST